MQRAPVDIAVRTDGSVQIRWNDEHESTYAAAALRLACSCATCVDEWSGDRRLRPEDVELGVRPASMQLVGNYALHITWSDGHSTGIYTWDALRRLCPCGECARPGA